MADQRNKKPDFALERGLPANLDAERMVLGALLSGEDFNLIRGSLAPADFSLEKHRRIYARMEDIFKRGERVDLVAVGNELMKHGQLESSDGLTYLSELLDIPSLANLEGWVRIVQEKSVLRRGALACSAMMDRFLSSGESPADLLGDAERVIRELSSQTETSGNLQSAAEIVAQVDLNAIGKVPAEVIRTPYAGLNRRIVGLYPGQLNVIGARPSAGKSVQAIEYALAAAIKGIPVAVFSLEMSKQAVLMRCACNRAQVDNSNVRHGRMSETERFQFVVAMSEIKNLPLYVDDKAHTFAAMAAEVRRMRATPRLMIVDHLHLMRSPGRHENRNNELAGITREMKLFAGETGMSILLLAQLSRALEKENRSPEMRDLRDCGSIEADADVITFLHRKEAMTAEDVKAPVPVDMLLAKQREGVSMSKIPLLLVGKYYKFREVDEAHAED